MMKKKRIRKVIPWIAVAAVALLLGLLPTLARNAAEDKSAVVLTAMVTPGEIENTLGAGGTLTAEEAVEVKIPETVELEEFLVENGDRVEEGQPLARVNRVTLLGAMTAVQDSLDQIAEGMREVASTAKSVTIGAQTRGRVKAVYAQPDDDVRQVMLAHGALAVVSLDGMMAAEIKTALPIRAGESLTLRFSDGTELPGRVETALEGKLSVTLTDNGPALGDTVTAFTDDGQEVGTGTLRAHSAWNVLATDGTVSAVYVKENQQIYAGGGILRIAELSGSAEYQALAAKHGKYEELMQDLFALYQDDTVKAPSAGFVSGIDKDMIKNLSAAENRAEIRLLAEKETAEKETAEKEIAGTTSLLVTGVNGREISGIAVSGDIDISSLSALLVLLSRGNTAPLTIPEDLEVPAVGDLVLLGLDKDGAVVSVTVTGHAEINGLLNDVRKATQGIIPGQQNPAAIFSGIDIAALLGGGAGAAQEGNEEDSLYTLEEKCILSVTPDNVMTVSVTVDELDILAYDIGMRADVTVDALPDRSFSAEVIEIGAIGENAGGNSKFKVKLRLDRAPDMLDGMNASVVVHRDSKSALLLPVAAVYDRGSESYIYAALDNKSGKPTMEVPVTTGVSDGQQVEILSGLTEGQPVFYEYYLSEKDTKDA